MENQNQESASGQQTINIQVPSADNIASRRSLIPILFAVVIIFFFFNFFTVSCGGQKVSSITGINLVTGTELKDHDLFSGKETKGEKIPSSMWAIIAFGAAIIGLGAFLIKEKNESLIGTGAGAIGFGSLLILQFAIKDAIEKKAEGSPIQTDFEFAYWGALIAMGIAGFISYLRMQRTHNIIVSVGSKAGANTENINQPQAIFSALPINKMKGIAFIIVGVLLLPIIMHFKILAIIGDNFNTEYAIYFHLIVSIIALFLVCFGIKILFKKVFGTFLIVFGFIIMLYYGYYLWHLIAAIDILKQQDFPYEVSIIFDSVLIFISAGMVVGGYILFKRGQQNVKTPTAVN